MELNNLIAECTTYDFKVILEERKPKSWLKSVSAFANGLGGSLFFGIENDGVVKGIDDVQHVCETISSKIREMSEMMSETELTERQKNIINLIRQSPSITAKRMSETLSVSSRTIERDLSALQKRSILKHTGKDNDGEWMIIEPKNI